MDFHLKKGGGSGEGRLPVHGSVAMEERRHAKEKRDRIQRLSLQTDDTSGTLFPCCATQSPHEEVVIIKYLCGTLLYCIGRMGFVLYRSDDLIPPNSTCRITYRKPKAPDPIYYRKKRFQCDYPGL